MAFILTDNQMGYYYITTEYFVFNICVDLFIMSCNFVNLLFRLG